MAQFHRLNHPKVVRNAPSHQTSKDWRLPVQTADSKAPSGSRRQIRDQTLAGHQRPGPSQTALRRNCGGNLERVGLPSREARALTHREVLRLAGIAHEDIVGIRLDDPGPVGFISNAPG